MSGKLRKFKLTIEEHALLTVLRETGKSRDNTVKIKAKDVDGLTSTSTYAVLTSLATKRLVIRTKREYYMINPLISPPKKADEEFVLAKWQFLTEIEDGRDAVKLDKQSMKGK